MKRIALFAALLLLLTPAPARADKTNLKIGISQYPATLHPLFDSMVAQSYVLGATLRPMTIHGLDWKPVCAVCTELPSFENGLAKRETRKDGKPGVAATYALKDLYWGDGVPVTSQDIVFAWQVGRHPQSGVSNAELFAKDIVDIEVKDDKTFIVHFEKEKCDFAVISDFYPLPAHLEKPIFDKDPAAYMNLTLYNAAPSNPGLWFGPYKVSKAEAGAAITLSRNPHWKGAVPVFETVTLRAIENSAALSANLLSGDVDYIAGEIGLLLDQAIAFEKRLEAARPGKYDVIYKPGLTFEHIDLALDNPVFKDARVRRALMLSMDRQALNDTLFGGRQQAAQTAVNPLDSVFTPDVAQYPFDAASAGKLLDEAGWKTGADGFRYDASGAKLAFSLSTTAGNKTRETVAQAIQSDWRKVGIDVTLAGEPPRVLFGETMRKRSFKGGVMYAWMSAPRNVPRTTLHSAMIPSAGNGYAGQNYMGYSSKDMDGIIDSLETVCAPAENAALWERLQKLYADDLPALPLYYRADSYFIPKWLTGIRPTGHMSPTTLWIEEWRASE